MTTAQIVEAVKGCGQSLIHNAESIAGDYKYQTELEVYITIPVTGGTPEIRVESVFLPETNVERNCIATIKVGQG